jgi:DNA-binding response OmpR family regulator
MNEKRVLIAEDETDICNLLMDIMPCEYVCSIVHTGKELYSLLTGCRNYYDLAIVDIHMPNWNGDEAVDLATALGSNTKIVYISGDHQIDGCLKKPFSADEFLAAIEEQHN